MTHRRTDIITGRLLAMGWSLAVVAASAVFAQVPSSYGPTPPFEMQGGARWFKGNTHTHSWWSDGDSPPETIVAWYKEHGYDFLVLSDHNILAEGEKWIEAKGARAKAGEAYERAFGPDWVVKRTDVDGKTEYRLKTLAEFRTLFEEPGRFLLIPGEEITDNYKEGKRGYPVHLNGVNLRELIAPCRGGSVLETLQNNVDAVNAQRERTGQPMFPHINHPNFQWGLRAEDIMQLRGEQFFEVYNGHSGVRNDGDENHPSTERMWDIILTKRLTELSLPIMYGVATDDAHAYTAWGVGKTNPGRGWVMVRAKFLTPPEIVLAMERGDFYASTGVLLKDVRFEDNTLTVEIQPRAGVSYTTQFVGTLRDHDPGSTERAAGDDTWITRKYSDDIGRVLAEQAGSHASYKLTGDELYVRAKIISTAKHPNPFAEGDPEVAWTQPVQPRKPAAGET